MICAASDRSKQRREDVVLFRFAQGLDELGEHACRAMSHEILAPCLPPKITVTAAWQSTGWQKDGYGQTFMASGRPKR